MGVQVRIMVGCGEWADEGVSTQVRCECVGRDIDRKMSVWMGRCGGWLASEGVSEWAFEVV